MNAVADHLTRRFIGAVEDEWQLYSNNAADYDLGPPIGFGASSIVYAARYKPSDDEKPVPCAIKVLDLDRLPPSALRLLQNETQLMSLSKHPNVLRVRGSWVEGHKLYIAMRLMNAGSVADVMRYQWPGGLEEEVIRCILGQALQGLNYFHINGLIHRDVKAANLLIDDDGTVLLGDLGVAAFLWDSEGTHASHTSKSRTINFETLTRHSHTSHSRPSVTVPPRRPSILGKRKSFVGTPCWMAPEVIHGKQYDASADIWSFGITAIELAQGRAPRSRMDPQKVLLMTVTESPPQLERKGGTYRYSSTFAETVALCLNKDPSKRPTASELLQTPFFRNARKPNYLCSTILRGLPPLTSRQERREQPSNLTQMTMDSWDFNPSLPASPTTSVYSRHRRPMSLLPPNGVFEMEDGDGAGQHPPSGDSVDAQSHGGHGHDNDVAPTGHSSAEAYAVQIRTQHRSPAGRSLHSHSRSNSFHSHHSRSHSRHQSHDDLCLSVDSIQEDSDAAEETTDAERDQEQVTQGIPVAISRQSGHDGTLAVPLDSSAPYKSPSPSSRSSASVTSSTSSPLTPSTPPSSSFINSAKSKPSKLWRKLAGKYDSEPEGREPPPTPTIGARKLSFGGVLGRTAQVGADLVRTANRTVSSSKQT